MLKSNYRIKRWLDMAKSQSSGFLLIELMVAVVIGLVLISSLMRMQSLLLELQDSFYMRDKALGIAVESLEQGNLNKTNGESAIFVSNGRNFRLSFDQNSIEQNSFVQNSFVQNSFTKKSFAQIDKNKPVTKVKVEWRSLVGKNCCLEI